MKVLLASILAIFVFTGCCCYETTRVTTPYYAPYYYSDVMVYDYVPTTCNTYRTCNSCNTCR